MERNIVPGYTHAHKHIHAGEAFSVHYVVTTASTDDHKTAIGFKTPNTTKWGHLVITISTTDPAEFFLDEAPTIDDDAGTQKAIINRNRNSVTVSGVSSLEDPIVANKVTTYTEAQMAAANYTAGLILANPQLAAGANAFAVGGTQRGVQEWLVKQNTKYLFILQNVGANANTHAIQLDWYEHTVNNTFEPNVS